MIILFNNYFTSLLSYLLHKQFTGHAVLCAYSPLHAPSGDSAETQLNSSQALHPGKQRQGQKTGFHIEEKNLGYLRG